LVLADLESTMAAAAAAAATPASADHVSAVFALRHAKGALLLQDEFPGPSGCNAVAVMH